MNPSRPPGTAAATAAAAATRGTETVSALNVREVEKGKRIGEAQSGEGVK